MKFSIIIPSLNEEKFIFECLNHIRKNFITEEIILADAGSTDRTIEIASQFTVSIVKADKGRGTQMNAGAEKAIGDILIFIHADTFIPENAKQIIESQFENLDTNIAAFRLGFDFDHKTLNFYTKFSKYDSVFTKFGDQCIIIRKTFYDALGGFPNWSIFEDVQLLRNARKKSKIHILDASVVTSARKFLRGGIIQTQFKNAFLFLQYFLGKDQNKIAKSYYSMNVNKKNALIIFAKYPKHGNVKTRLAKSLGENFATKFYINCAEQIFRETRKLRKTVVPFLFHPDKEKSEELKNWAGGNFIYKFQKGNDLGARLLNAFTEVFKNNFERIIVIGTDIPDISSEIINNAFAALEHTDVVIGPSTDGGYYLLGMKRLYPNIFDDIPWSTKHVLSRTLSSIAFQNLSCKCLEELIDIDTEEDLKIWYSRKNIAPNPVKEFIRLTLQQAN